MLRIAAALPVAFAVFLAASASQAVVRSEEVTYEHAGTPLKGHLAYDDASSEKRPCVLVVHEWWGLNDYARKRADQLAALGYLALAVDMYGEGKTAAHPKEAGEFATAARKNPEVTRGRFLSAVDLLRKHKLADGSRTAAIGYCFGGGVVLDMARRGVDLLGVVSFHGALAPNSAVKGAEKIKARVLVCHGADDPMVKPADVAAFEEEMRAAGADWQLNVYGGAKHSFTNPDAGSFGMDGLAYSPSADRRSWAAMKLLFAELFGGQ